MNFNTVSLGYQLVLLHTFKATLRSQRVGRNLFAVILLVIFGTTFAWLLSATGIAYSELIREALPQYDPIQLLNRNLLFFFISLQFARFFLQRSSRIRLQPYLHLPVRRVKLVRLAQMASSATLFNFLPLCFIVPLWYASIWDAPSKFNNVEAVLWLTGFVMLLSISHVANNGLRALAEIRLKVFVWAFFIVSVLIGMDTMSTQAVLPDLSKWLFGQLLNGSVLIAGVLAAATVGSLVISNRILLANLREEPVSSAEQRRSGFASPLSAPLSAMAPLVLLELKLYARNKRPRQMFYSVLAMFVYFLGFMIVSAGTQGPFFFYVVCAFFITGFAILTYGQLLFGWDSEHFDAMLNWPLNIREYISAKLLTMYILCSVCFILAIPAVLIFTPNVILTFLVLWLYNMGVSSLIMLAASLRNDSRITLSKGTLMNYEGFSTDKLLLPLVLYLPPAAVVMILDRPQALAVLAALGLASVVASPLVITLLTKPLQRRKYNMADGFRSSY